MQVLDLLDLEIDGACLHSGLATGVLDDLSAALAPRSQSQPGIRLFGDTGLSAVLGPGGPLWQPIVAALGSKARAVRAVLFDKHDGNNWALGWHQDRTIAVRRRAEVAGYGPWSVKRGMVHVEPPFALIEAMLTVRIHLDRVDDSNAPLIIARGSHRLGRIPAGDVATIAEGSTVARCLADAGDVWFYRTTILHASNAARPGRRRRVDYCGQDLPGGLEWLGI